MLRNSILRGLITEQDRIMNVPANELTIIEYDHSDDLMLITVIPKFIWTLKFCNRGSLKNQGTVMNT